MTNPHDRRRTPRVTLSNSDPVPCQLCHTDHGPVIMGFLLDLSETGAAVRVDFPIDVELESGEEVLLRTTLPDSVAPCRFVCKVRHIQVEDDSKVIGLELTGAWSRSHFHVLMARLKRFVQRLLGSRRSAAKT